MSANLLTDTECWSIYTWVNYVIGLNNGLSLVCFKPIVTIVRIGLCIYAVTKVPRHAISYCWKKGTNVSAKWEKMAYPIVCLVTAFSNVAALVLNVTAPSPYYYCTIAVNKGAVTAAFRGSTITDLGLRSTRQAEPYIPWSRFTHTLSCYTQISTVRALVCATAPPVRSPAKASTILNESVTAITASRFSPVNIIIYYRPIWTKWPTLCKRHIRKHFPEWRRLNFE